MKLAIGFFDGVHLGHQRILAGADAALTFRAHPLSVLAPDKAPPLLMTPEERFAAIAAALKGFNGLNGFKGLRGFNGLNGFKGLRDFNGLNGFKGLRGCNGLNGFKDLRDFNGLNNPVRALDFTRELAAEPAEAFAARLRRDYLDLEAILCGPNWRFGAGGAGDADFLRARGFAVEVVPLEELDGAPVSSTRIRAALQAGDLPAANAMLGRPFAIVGAVVPGKGEGRKLGFPTINVQPANPCLACLLPLGVYVADTVWGRAVANWGQAPTMGEQAWTSPVLEVHIIRPLTPLKAIEPLKPLKSLGALEPLRPLKALTVSLLRFLRPERRFASAEALREQIKADVFSASHSPKDRL